MNNIISKDATDLATHNYTEYAIYVNSTRANPSIYDGLKTVQRRIIYRLSKLPVGKIYKSTELDGMVMAYHPHGGSYGPMANMACQSNNLPLFDVQGNFGGIGTGPSAARYTGASLNKIARFIYCQFIDSTEFVEGELKREPKYLPCLIPYSFIENSSGMGVGLTSDMLPFDLMELIDYYIKYIENDYKFDKDIPLLQLGSAIIDMDRDEYNEQLLAYKNSISVIPIMKQESESVYVLESLNGLSIDKLCRKLGKYIDNDQVDFRDESKKFERYVFEIMDMSVHDEFVRDLERFSRKRIPYRFTYAKDSVSLFCNINYVIKTQMNVLNKAIDKKLETDKENVLARSRMLRALKWFKDNKLFNDLSKYTSEELIDKLMSVKLDIDKDINVNLDAKLCQEIISKPISYLTKSHDKELKDLEDEFMNIESHDRKKYLIGLYNQLREMIRPIYDERKHTMLKSDMIKKPRARMVENNVLEVRGRGRGEYFEKYLVLIGDEGSLYKHPVSVVKNSTIDLPYEENIVGIVGDWARYVELIANDNTSVVFDMNNYKYNKKVANLNENQKIVDAKGYTEKDVTDDVLGRVRTKISKTIRR